MSALASLTIFPVDKGLSVSLYVAKAVKIIKNSGLNYELGPMNTCIEGEWNEVMNVVNKCMEIIKSESSRVYMVLNVDYRDGEKGRIKKKVESIENKLHKI